MRRRRIGYVTAPRQWPDVGYSREVVDRVVGQVHGGLDVLGLELEPSLSMRVRRMWRRARRRSEAVDG